MTTLAPAAAPAASNHDFAGAAELARRIQIPRQLPVRHDGQQLRHLSHSSYSRFLLCPEDWRRHYLRGERTPPSAAIARKVLIAAWHVLSRDEPFTPSRPRGTTPVSASSRCFLAA